jgi:hypothetical protein
MALAKAAARNMKSYLRKNDYRDIAVGYAAASVLSPRRDLADYLNCGDRPVDFLGINLFSWCGDSSCTVSGCSGQTKNFVDYSILVLLSGYGYNIPSPRNFTEVQAIYSQEMISFWPGGLYTHIIRTRRTMASLFIQ